MKIRKLSVIVPVYNETGTVVKVIKRLSELSLGGRKIEIIVVDDGSTDGSTRLIKNLKSKIRNFKCIFHKTNQGKGAAIQTALKEATGEYVVIQDADLEYNPDEIAVLVKKAEKENLMVVFGSRDREIKNKYLYPHYYWGSKSLCILMNLVFGEKFTDPETCYKLVQTDLLKFIDISEKGFGVEMEMAAKIARIRIPYGEVAITYNPRTFAEGKKIGVKDGVRAVYLIWKYWEHDLHYGIVDRVLREIRLQKAMKYLHFEPTDVVFDMGCGRQANLGWRLRTRVLQYVGVDREVPDVEMGNVVLKNIDLEKKFPYRSGAVDKIVGAAILEHLNNPTGFIKECGRLLKKGGLLTITTPAPPYADMILKILVGLNLIEGDEVHDHVGYFSLENLEKTLKENGFEIMKKERFLAGLNNLIVVRKTGRG